jgi:hypothetical protein
MAQIAEQRENAVRTIAGIVAKSLKIEHGLDNPSYRLTRDGEGKDVLKRQVVDASVKIQQ